METEFTKKMRRLLWNGHAINQVITNVILVAVIIALGFAVQIWAYQKSIGFNTDYASAVDEDVVRVKEKLAFEYIFYNFSQQELTVYLINCGNSDDVHLTEVYLNSTVGSHSFDAIELRFLNGTLTQSLDIGEEGYFRLSVDLMSVRYFIRIITQRERWYVETFVP